MARKSLIEREKKKIKLVEKFSQKRSALKLRELAMSGKLPGIKKSSW